ncbi:MAG: hypothetical protein IAF02_12765 [Anaerolineae bacterium]|nr:hypothetical protein [Anaerolineae bacterium]
MKALGWFIWGIIVWIDSHFLNRFRREKHKYQKKSSLSKIANQLKIKLISIEDQARNWTVQQESPSLKQIRKSFTANPKNTDRKNKNDLVQVYEDLRNYILTDNWKPQIAGIYYVVVLLILIISLFYPTLYSYLKIASIEWGLNIASNSFQPIFAISIIVVLISLFSFFSVLKQLVWWQRIYLVTLAFISLLYSINKIFSVPDFLYISDIVLVCITFFHISAILVTIEILVYAFQWRILSWPIAIWNWALLTSSSIARLELIHKINAWLVLFVPKRNQEFIWDTSKEMDLLIEMSSVERDGAEWRSIILTILALLGINNLIQFLNPLFEWKPIELKSSLMSGTADFVNYLTATSFWSPVGTITILMIAAFLWSILMEIWLSETPNRIISVCAIQVKQVISSGQILHERELENYRIITTHKPLDEKNENLGINIIAEDQVSDNKWIYLIQKRYWLLEE